MCAFPLGFHPDHEIVEISVYENLESGAKCASIWQTIAADSWCDRIDPVRQPPELKTAIRADRSDLIVPGTIR